MTPESAPAEAAALKGNPYRPVRAVLEEVIEETSTIKTFRIKPDEPVSFATGQFVELAVPGLGEAPFTPSSSPAVSDRMDLTVMRAGLVTERLHALEAGAELGVRGPLGKGYPLDEFAGRPILVLGGGVGFAPLRSLLYALVDDPKRFGRILVCYGARTPEDLVYRQSYEEWGAKKGLELHVSVDKEAPGWKGNVGVVTTLLDKVKLDPKTMPAVVCGPPIMMKFGTLKLIELGFPPESIYLSMEKNMSCGVGKCGHCRVGPYFVCKDGPVLTYAQVKDIPRIWD